MSDAIDRFALWFIRHDFFDEVDVALTFNGDYLFELVDIECSEPK